MIASWLYRLIFLPDVFKSYISSTFACLYWTMFYIKYCSAYCSWFSFTRVHRLGIKEKIMHWLIWELPNENTGDPVNSNISNKIVNYSSDKKQKVEIIYIYIVRIYEKGLSIRHITVITVYCYTLLFTVVIKVFLYKKYSDILFKTFLPL